MARPLPHHGAIPLDAQHTSFGLWAPHAETVELALGDDGGRLPMDDRGDGWWTLAAPASHGSRYGYHLDGGELLPDPAARWLPDGVHAPAAVVDPARLTVSATRFNAAPVTGAVIYELHVGTFTPQGTFAAAIAHLPELADLGITHVEVMPVNAFDGRHGWGYDGVAWWAAHQPYGGPEGFAAFVAACHDAGLAVILDVVHNHLGPSGNYLPRFGPYLQSDAESTWGKVINLDGPGSGPVRSFIIGSALAWLRDSGVDALRLDAVHALDDRGSATHLLAELADAVAAESTRSGRHLELIAESDRNDPQTIRPRALGGLGLDAQWADDLHHAIHVTVTGEVDGYYVDYEDAHASLVAALTGGFVYDGSRHSAYRGRVVGAPLPTDTSLRRLIACVQNHDQVGNRPAGDRLTTQVEPDRARLAIALLCTAGQTPMLFMGEEYGETRPFAFFCDHPGEELRQAIRDGRREEFADFRSWQAEVPDPLDLATYEGSKLDRSQAVTGQGRARRALWRDLLALRRTQPALGTGDRALLHAEQIAGGVRLHRRPPAHSPLAAEVLVLACCQDEPIARPASLPGTDGLLLSTADPTYGGPGISDDHVSAWTVEVHALPQTDERSRT